MLVRMSPLKVGLPEFPAMEKNILVLDAKTALLLVFSLVERLPSIAFLHFPTLHAKDVQSS